MFFEGIPHRIKWLTPFWFGISGQVLGLSFIFRIRVLFRGKSVAVISIFY